MTDTTMIGTAKGLGGREAMTNTWLGLEDLPDSAPRACTIETDQEEYMIEHLGLTLWAALCELEDGIRP